MIDTEQNTTFRYYVSLKDVEDYLFSHFHTYGEEVSFKDAVMALYAKGAYHPHTTNPDFRTCDAQTTMEEFRALVYQTSIDVTDLILDPSRYQRNMHMENLSFFHKDVYTIFTPIHEMHHMHSVDCFEISIVLNGQCKLQLQDEMRLLKPGHVIFFSPGTLHDLYAEEGSLMLTLLIKKSTFQSAFQNILAADSVLSDFFHHSLYQSAENYLLFATKLSEHFLAIIYEILIESNGKDSYARTQCNLYVSLLLGEILRNYSHTYSSFAEEKSSHYNIPLILAYIKTNLKHVTLTQVANFFGYNKDYLGKLIYRCTGRHYNEILNTYRMEKACNLLQFSNQSIAEIAQECGYHSAYHFNRTFHKYKKTSASQYRKQYCNADSTSLLEF